MAETITEAPLQAYWQPGCTSCLRMKEFLTRHGVPFVSVNVLADREAFQELRDRFGIRTVPIIRRGDNWANGQVLRDVARLAGIPWGGTKMLSPAEMMERLDRIQSAAQRYLKQMPEDALATQLPNRPRSYLQLVYHLFNIADAFLEHETQGLPLIEGAYNRVPTPENSTKAYVLAYGEDVLARFRAWFAGPGQTVDWQQKAKVYYGDQTLHEYFERTTWHSGQHSRQLMMVLEMLGIEPDGRLGPEVFAGLPMPEKVWDDEQGAAAA